MAVLCSCNFSKFELCFGSIMSSAASGGSRGGGGGVHCKNGVVNVTTKVVTFFGSDVHHNFGSLQCSDQ